jgi:hypothetical protein
MGTQALKVRAVYRRNRAHDPEDSLTPSSGFDDLTVASGKQARYDVARGVIIVAYEPGFYVPENIIGYTGVLNKNPTVYFLSKTHYGHITQVHDEWRNVGRETIRSNAQYFFGNVGDGNALFERDPGVMTHQSRSPMILVGSTLPPELSHAIMVHSEQKALRDPGAKPVVTNANRTRREHPGQQPTDEERSGARGVSFQWEWSKIVGVPEDTRLAKIVR